MALQLEDLLKDELAGGEPVEAWECALQSMFLRLDPSALSRYRLAKLKDTIPKAIVNLEKWVAKAREIGALRKIDPDEELSKFQSGITKLHQALQGSVPQTSEGRELYQCVLEQLDEEVFQFLSLQDRFYRNISTQMSVLDAETHKTLRQALHSLEQGLSEVGLERNEHLRMARNNANVVATMPFGEQCCVATLIAGVANWKTTRSSMETKRFLRRAWPRAQASADVVTAVFGRMLGHLDCLDDDLDLAWSELSVVADLDVDDESILEAARLAVKLRKWEQSRRLIRKGMEQSGLFAIRMLACPEMMEVAGEVLEALVECQRTNRQQAGAELTNWNDDMNRIRRSIKQSKIEVPSLDSLEEIRTSIARRIPAADLILATALTLQARNARHEAVRLTKQQISNEHTAAAKGLQASKLSVDQAWAEREAMIEAATERQKTEVQVARDALQVSIRDADKTQAGCVVGFGSGCGAFLLYLIIAAFLTAQGVSAGFGTIFGWFGIAASGIPITMSVLSQIAYGAQRVALDKVLQDKIAVAQAAYKAAASQADDYYREKILKMKEAVLELEAKARRMEEALAILNAAT